MIRGILILIEILFLILVSIFAIPIIYIIDKFNKALSQKFSQSLVYFFASLTIFICGTEVEIIGRENLPDEPCLYISNHRGYFDIIISMTFIRKRTFYVAKKSIGKIPLLHFYMIKMGCLLIDRDDIKQSLGVILKSIDQVNDGFSCYIYPEGTRTSSPDHEMLPFKEGSFKISTKTNVPICPITILHTRDIYERQAPRFKKAKVIFIIDKPVYPNDLSPEDKKFIGKYCQNIVENNIKKYLD